METSEVIAPKDIAPGEPAPGHKAAFHEPEVLLDKRIAERI